MTEGAVVLITGTSSGIGRRMAETFARAEHRVYAGMREPEGKNAAAKAELEALARAEGLSLEVVALDVTDDVQVEAEVAGILGRTGRIDVLVNNAGLSLVGLSECSSLEQVRRVFEVNYFGVLRMCRAVLPGMRERHAGLVVHVSSIGGRATMPNSAYYCGTKAAIEALGESQRYELASFGVDVVLVEPGAYGTNIFENAMVQDDRERASEYGALATKGEQGVAIAKQMIADRKLDAQVVADEVLRLARLPMGQRPLRTLVGDDAKMLEPINAVTGPLAEAMFKAFGFL